MSRARPGWPGSLPGTTLAVGLLTLLALPMVALALSSSPAQIAAGVRHPLFRWRRRSAG